MATIKRNSACRICKSLDLLQFLKLGPTPLANGFLTFDQLNGTEASYPLDLHYCKNCGLVQLLDIVPKESLFKHYIYYSSISKTFTEHCAQVAKEIVERFAHSPSPLVVEIGSNDGVFLKHVKKLNVRVTGIEPASNLAEAARSADIDTIDDFFSGRLAREIVASRGKAGVIIGMNVFSHIDDLHDLMKGAVVLLSDDGAFILEDPYFADVIENTEYDQFYHEHLSYFSIRPLVNLFDQYGMEIFDVKREPKLHGGSIRVYARRRSSGSMPPVVRDLMALEYRMRLDQPQRYLEFASQVTAAKKELSILLKRIKGEGKRIVGYGASSKGNVILNVCDIGPETLDYIVDATPAKQGLYTPGKHIPVLSETKFRESTPDYALLFAWNFADEILGKEVAFRESGGKFIVPVPWPKILSSLFC